jgi:hypothetical protein
MPTLQVHLSLTGKPSEMLVQWATAAVLDAASVTVLYSTQADLSQPVTVYGGTVSSYTQLQYFDVPALLQPDMDEVSGPPVSTAELCQLLAVPEHLGGLPPNCSAATRLQPQTGNVNNPDHVYSSPSLVSVLLQNLNASTRYFYRLSGDPPSTARSFTTLPPHATHSEAFPTSFAVFADVGQTVVSAANIAALADDSDTRLVLLAGDLSYADGLGERWDTWGELMSMLLSSRPMAATVGNHELERGENGVPMLARYPTPYVAAKSSSPYEYSFDAGPAHIIVLNSYAGARGAARQVAWLRGALARVDRRRTPWLIAMFHTSWYSSHVSRSYRNAGEPLRWATEEMLAAAGVDIVFSGHLHHYERSFPVVNRTREACGPVHLNVGAAGCVRSCCLVGQSCKLTCSRACAQGSRRPDGGLQGARARVVRLSAGVVRLRNSEAGERVARFLDLDARGMRHHQQPVQPGRALDRRLGCGQLRVHRRQQRRGAQAVGRGVDCARCARLRQQTRQRRGPPVTLPPFMLMLQRSVASLARLCHVIAALSAALLSLCADGAPYARPVRELAREAGCRRAASARAAARALRHLCVRRPARGRDERARVHFLRHLQGQVRHERQGYPADVHAGGKQRRAEPEARGHSAA